MPGDEKARNEEQWRTLISQLSGGNAPHQLPVAPATAFDDQRARQRVGAVITKAVLGEPMYRLYRLYCGDPSRPT